ncbi:MAG: hypothetical protein IPL78_26600 [Chloroflexi bacterium]|nr:hypothetical protein [Chloroflexota bacterium]
MTSYVGATFVVAFGWAGTTPAPTGRSPREIRKTRYFSPDCLVSNL